MNKIIILVMVLGLGLNAIDSIAAPDAIGSGFSYQGELLESGSPANGSYDVIVDAYYYPDIGSVVATQTFLAITVTNGLFNIPEVDFGNALYNGYEVWLEVSVRPAGVGVYTALTPRQRVSAAPYAVQAEFLAANGASNGEVLQFDGNNWVAAAISGFSPWSQSGITLSSPGKVGIGEPTPSAQLHVTNNQSQISLLKVDDVSDTRFVVQATGRTGVGVNNPSDRLHINSSVGENPFRVQVDGSTKFRIRDNGGVAVGLNVNTVPDNGLYVHGDVRQNENSSGMVKYMIRANCDATPTITQSYNGTNVTGAITITRSSIGDCTILVPSSNITNNYISVSARNNVPGNSRIVTCIPLLGGIICKVTNESGVDVNGNFDVLVY
ncbi:MAG: hypothetical protein L3J53_00760 [Proteobacteria bacterium]|nr:hypothetical protein [Pseudomonadota bacterium]